MITRSTMGGLLTLLLGSVYLYFAYQIPYSALADTMGAGGVPCVYGWLMVLLSVLLIGQAQWEYWRSPERKPLALEWKGHGIKTLKAAGLLGFGILYLFLVDSLGYLLSIALLLIGVSFYRGAPWGKKLFLTGIGGAILLWIIFAFVLGVKMPMGFLKGLGI